MQPATPLHGLEGMKHLETAIVPGIYDASVADRKCHGRNRRRAGDDAPIGARRRLIRRRQRRRKRFRRASFGANIKNKAVIVTILCDGGGKYLNEDFWDEA